LLEVDGLKRGFNAPKTFTVCLPYLTLGSFPLWGDFVALPLKCPKNVTVRPRRGKKTGRGPFRICRKP
jgi:hypothetical protein